MPSASAVNSTIIAAVETVRDQYVGFTQALRGLSADTLTGLSNGTMSFIGVNQGFERLNSAALSALSNSITEVVREVAVNAQGAVEQFDDAVNAAQTLVVADTLSGGFAASLIETIEQQMRADIRHADTFVRTQLTQGRFFATADQISTDLAFKRTDRAGRQLDSADFIQREVNWALRQHHNTVLIYGLSTAGHEQAVIEGGSKAGLVIQLDDYDKHLHAIFHHNSKAILLPNYSVS